MRLPMILKKLLRNTQSEIPKKNKNILPKENQYSKGSNPVVTYMLPRIRSKYIAILNGDDYWTDKSKLQKQYKILENDDNCVIVHHNCYKVFDTKQIKEVYHKKIIPTINFEDILKQNKISTSTVLFRNIKLR